MPQDRKGPIPPENLGQRKLSTTQMFKPVRARTVVGVCDATLPPLAEDLVALKDIEGKRIFPFDIVVNPNTTLRVTGKIGEGGMGEVFRAVRVLTSPSGKKDKAGEVAVKLVHVSDEALGSDPKMREVNRLLIYDRFFDEVVIASQIQSKHVVQIFSLFGMTPHPRTKEEVPWFSMELLKGKDMDMMLQEKGRFKWQELRPLILQVCSALAAAHGNEDENKRPRPIIHLDMKPLNIFVIEDDAGEPQAKVLDFGLAQVLSSLDKGKDARNYCGTPDYMSPEQAKGETVDHRTDIYALGVTMYQLLSGRVPFSFIPPKTPSGKMEAWLRFCARVLNDAPPALRDSGIDIPEDAEMTVMRCLAKEPADRFQSVSELQKAINRCGQSDEPKEESAAEAASPPPMGYTGEQGHAYRGIVPGLKVEGPRASYDEAPSGASSDTIRLKAAPGKGRRLAYGLLASTLVTAVAGGLFLMGRPTQQDAHAPALGRAADSSIRAPLLDLMAPLSPDAGSPPDITPDLRKDIQAHITPRPRQQVRKDRHHPRRQPKVKKRKFLIDSE